MALDFPSSPTNGQIYGNYYYDSSRGVWRANAPLAAGIPQGGAANYILTKTTATDFDTSWQPGPGLVPVIPTSVSSTGGSISYNSATGKITATGANTAIVIDGVFTSSYTNYRIVVNDTAGSDYCYFRSVNAGTVLTSASYSYQSLGAQAGSLFYASGFYDAAATFIRLSAMEANQSARAFDVFSPFLSSQRTSLIGNGRWSTASPTTWTFSGAVNTASTTTGFSLLPPSGTFAQTIMVYGYKD